jgi:hypothetical protein
LSLGEEQRARCARWNPPRRSASSAPITVAGGAVVNGRAVRDLAAGATAVGEESMAVRLARQRLTAR